MPTDKEDLKQVASILRKYKRIAVIGLSPDAQRPSYGVTRYMIDHGYEIFGVRPNTSEILGRPCFTDLEAVPAPLEIIDVFRNSDAVPAIIDEIAALSAQRRPKVLWLQEGVTNAEAEARARALGLIVIANRCILKEHRNAILM